MQIFFRLRNRSIESAILAIFLPRRVSRRGDARRCIDNGDKDIERTSAAPCTQRQRARLRNPSLAFLGPGPWPRTRFGSDRHSRDPPPLQPKEQQRNALAIRKRNVQKLQGAMLTALDKNNMREALRRAMELLGELRNDELSPPNYYDLYMDCIGVLHRLEQFIIDSDTRGKLSVVDLYESVQHAGTILPRLYLLATVGSAYIKSKKAPAKDILFDMVELTRGVQHPVRGLFLRNYLSQVTRDKLPDVDSEYEGEGGDIKDAIEFALQNFGEMNKLWVRMQHQGALRDLGRREQDRKNLKQLVGTTLVRLSQMEGVDTKIYTEMVLPKIIEITVNCKDVIAQQYLMDCIIQVFPSEFHLVTLEMYLKSIAHLKSKVSVNDIIVAMMNRLSAFVKDNPNKVPTDIDIFALFHKHVEGVIKKKTAAKVKRKMELIDILKLEAALLNFSAKCYPDNLENADSVLGSAAAFVSAGEQKRSPECDQIIKKLLIAPLETMQMRVLQLQNYRKLMGFLGYELRRDVAGGLAQATLDSGEALDSVAKVTTLFQFIEPMLKSDAKEGKAAGEIKEDAKFLLEQERVARLVHLMDNKDTDELFAIYETSRRVFAEGGAQRLKFTTPPLIFSTLALIDKVVQRIKAKESVRVKPKKLFTIIHKSLVVSRYMNNHPETALRLALKTAAVADRYGQKLEPIAYEFLTQAFIAYEDEITDSREQVTAIGLIISALDTFTCFSDENWQTLVTRSMQHSSQLLRKDDKARAVAKCAHLFWPSGGDEETKARRNEEKLMKYLKRALKTANDVMNGKKRLFVEILNEILFFFERRVAVVTPEYLQSLMSLIEATEDDEELAAETTSYYENTKNAIRAKQRSDDQEEAEHYQQIDLETGEGEAEPDE